MIKNIFALIWLSPIVLMVFLIGIGIIKNIIA